MAVFTQEELEEQKRFEETSPLAGMPYTPYVPAPAPSSIGPLERDPSGIFTPGMTGFEDRRTQEQIARARAMPAGTLPISPGNRPPIEAVAFAQILHGID